MEVGLATATTLDANYTIGDTAITVVSTTGMPTATGITFAIDQIDSGGIQVTGTYNEYVGTVASATSITNVSHQNGTNQNYTAGATTRVYIPVSAERENRIVEWGLVQHKQTGAHADTITTNTVNENTAANGVTVDGLNIKDGKLNTNDSVVTANITAAAITYAKLLSTIFSGQVTATTNSGAGGGTLNYVNLGGIKVAWGITASFTINTNTANVRAITYPTSFFSAAVTVAVGNAYMPTASPNISVYIEGSSSSSSGISFTAYNNGGGNGDSSVSWLVVGS